LLQNRGTLDPDGQSDFYQESGRPRKDCVGWIKNREKEMLTDEEKQKKKKV